MLQKTSPELMEGSVTKQPGCTDGGVGLFPFVSPPQFGDKENGAIVSASLKDIPLLKRSNFYGTVSKTISESGLVLPAVSTATT